MDWQKHIHSDPNVLIGKPVVKGTRLSVDFILDLLVLCNINSCELALCQKGQDQGAMTTAYSMQYV